MEPQGPGSDGWDAMGEGRLNGWPLGLHAARASVASTSAYLLSTPSATSFSSSEFDTESTGSFFPEKSTSLGSLIGFQSSYQLALENVRAIEAEKEKKSNNGSNSRSRPWRSLLGCSTSGMPPSPTDLISKKRREIVSERTGDHHSHGEHEPVHEHASGIASQRNVPCDTEPEMVANYPTLKFMLQQPSPTHYLSDAWDVYKDISHNHHVKRQRSRSMGGGQTHTFWPSFCGRLGTNVTN